MHRRITPVIDSSRIENLFNEVESHGFYSNSRIITEASTAELRSTMRMFYHVPNIVLDDNHQRLASILNISLNEVRSALYNIRLVARSIGSVPHGLLVNIIARIGELFVTRGAEEEYRHTGAIIFLTSLANSIGLARESYPFLVFDY
jgi:hypothetical protein